jgi:hypothetical protein
MSKTPTEKVDRRKQNEGRPKNEALDELYTRKPLVEIDGLEVDDEDTRQACEYLIRRYERQNVDDMARLFGLASRQALYARVRKWEASGVLKRAKDVVYGPAFDEVDSAMIAVVNEWDAILERVIKIAKYSQSEETALKAAVWLHNAIVEPMIAGREDSGSKEFNYSRSLPDFAPRNLPPGPLLVERPAKESGSD